MKRSVWVFVLLIIAIPVFAYGLLTWYQREYGQLPLYGSAGHKISDFNLTNQNGEPIDLEHWKGKIIIVNFFFTSCPSICPKMSANLKKLLDQLPGNLSIQVNSITVDPEKDDIGRLKKYATRYNAPDNWNFLTGEKKDIYRLARNSFLVVATDGDGGVNDFIHSEKLILVDNLNQIRGLYDGTNESQVNMLLKDVKKLLASGGN